MVSSLVYKMLLVYFAYGKFNFLVRTYSTQYDSVANQSAPRFLRKAADGEERQRKATRWCTGTMEFDEDNSILQPLTRDFSPKPTCGVSSVVISLLSGEYLIAGAAYRGWYNRISPIATQVCLKSVGE